MTENKNSKAKFKQILSDLKSGSDAKITSVIKVIQADGKPEMLPMLVEILHSNPSDLVKESILELFRSLKDSDAIPFMIEIINEDNNLSIRQNLLSTIWNTKLDYAPFIADFVGIATEGTFMEALECLTILENLDGPFEERHILEAQLFLSEYHDNKLTQDPQKAELISEIALLLKDWDRGIDAED